MTINARSSAAGRGPRSHQCMVANRGALPDIPTAARKPRRAPHEATDSSICLRSRSLQPMPGTLMHSLARLAAVPLAVLLTLPPFAKDNEPSRKVAISPDVVYGHKEGMALVYDVFTPAKANGSAVLF